MSGRHEEYLTEEARKKGKNLSSAASKLRNELLIQNGQEKENLIKAQQKLEELERTPDVDKTIIKKQRDTIDKIKKIIKLNDDIQAIKDGQRSATEIKEKIDNVKNVFGEDCESLALLDTAYVNLLRGDITKADILRLIDDIKNKNKEVSIIKRSKNNINSIVQFLYKEYDTIEEHYNNRLDELIIEKDRLAKEILEMKQTIAELNNELNNKDNTIKQFQESYEQLHNENEQLKTIINQQNVQYNHNQNQYHPQYPNNNGIGNYQIPTIQIAGQQPANFPANFNPVQHTPGKQAPKTGGRKKPGS